MARSGPRYLRQYLAEMLPVWREFERFSTAGVSAYIGPAVTRYLTSLEDC